MEKLAENDLTYFYLRHVVIVVTAVTMMSLAPVMYRGLLKKIVIVYRSKFRNEELKPSFWINVYVTFILI
jgi:hypothetical protein